ncbi:hypothetical protein MSG28_008930 [Choristoneura fumiferana]|uniref:Uncharacterized protein n=1 Tax=Choristoneura fumiferana TaxID=7141 RepID=A0ACC0J8J5_CHOFU|nr:hypothetical protein MSG28_008930 [Choristoneura fumiferana]
MDKAFEIQRQVRDNVSTLKTYLTDLQNWEVEMKRKEAALNGQDLPPVRSKAKKEKPVEKKKTVEKRLKSSDYKAWDSFDADKACEEIDMEDVGPTSLDGKKSQQAKMEKLREEAHHEKERGNAFVKQEKWDEAIACYNRAIELVKDDAIYYANRGLCYLKKDSLHQAETDCTEALRLDPTYVKALQRRATARERLGSLRAASHDLSEVLKYEPHNGPARKQLEVIKNRMGTKGSKSKSSPSSTPTSENKPFPRSTGQAKIVELKDEPALPVPELSEEEKWKNGVGECITVIKPVKKPPHLRSKRALKTVPILEIPLGKTEPEKPPTRLKIIEIEDDLSKGDTNNNDSNKSAKPNIMDSSGDMKSTDAKDVVVTSPESEKLVKDVIGSEKDVSLENMVPPVNSVQFMAEWKVPMTLAALPLWIASEIRWDKYAPALGSPEASTNRDDRAFIKNFMSADQGPKIIDPVKIPSIFDNALESDVLSDLLSMLAADTSKFADKTITAYLKGLTRVKRFSALAMFLSTNDKQTTHYFIERYQHEHELPVLWHSTLDFFYPDDTSCYRKDGDYLMSIEKKAVLPDSIFIIETTCQRNLGAREACTIEAIARSHPDKFVYVLFTRPLTEKECFRGPLGEANKFLNVHFYRANISTYALHTPLEEIFNGSLTSHGKRHHRRMAEYLKFLTLYHYGGLVVDLDMLVTAATEHLGSNWLVREDDGRIGSAVVSLSRDRVGRKVTPLVLSAALLRLSMCLSRVCMWSCCYAMRSTISTHTDLFTDLGLHDK